MMNWVVGGSILLYSFEHILHELSNIPLEIILTPPHFMHIFYRLSLEFVTPAVAPTLILGDTTHIMGF